MTRILIATLAVAISTLTCAAPALGAYIGTIPSADFNVLDGVATESIVVADVTDNGVTVDLTFTFTALAPGDATVAFDENDRLGVHSSYNQGQAGSTSVNDGESIQLGVTASVTDVPAGQAVTALDFGISRIGMVRHGGGTPGSARYNWNSSATAATFSHVSSETGGQSVDTMDDTSTFDILGTTYSGTFWVDQESSASANGFRWVTNANNVHFNLTAETIPLIRTPTDTRVVSDQTTTTSLGTVDDGTTSAYGVRGRTGDSGQDDKRIVTYLQFDVSDLSEAMVDHPEFSATFRIDYETRLNDINNLDFFVGRNTGGSWDSGGTNNPLHDWAFVDETSTVLAADGEFLVDGKDTEPPVDDLTADVSDIVTDWVKGTHANDGFVLYYNSNQNQGVGFGNAELVIVIPEPSTLALAAVGLGGLRRRRRRA